MAETDRGDGEYHMLIDAKNALYRAIYAAKAEERRIAFASKNNDTSSRYHYFTILLRQLVRWVNEFRPTQIHVFWDVPRKEVWRRKLHTGYKDRSSSQYVEDISEDLNMVTLVAKEFFDVMNVRQYYKNKMEADDLIYAATTLIHPHKSIIISSDSDMIQIPYTYNSSSQYDPGKRKMVDVPVTHPVIQKALVGDKADHIVGYRGIGPKKSQPITENYDLLSGFLEENGSDTFLLNMLLIDLSLNPKLLHNKLYVIKQMAKPLIFDKDKINKLIMEHKVNGMLQEYNDLVLPFANLK
jgi:5'-3' exonuclease